jgi:eukaryotic-like serine/threonine-protein kinase
MTASAKHADPQGRVGTTVAGRYFLQKLIGRGGMSDVYQATWLGPERPVALKLLRGSAAGGDEQVRRFEREAAAATRLVHPGSVEVLDFGRCPDGELFLAMELLPGRDLARVLSDEGQLTPERAARITGQLLDVLEAAHALGILHRDLKPANVMIAPAGAGAEQVKVLDFGNAWLDVPLPPDGRLTQEGFVQGTPAYMSPEQIRGEELDARSDLYAVGVVLYEMLAGVPPFGAQSAMAIAAQQLTEPPPPLQALCPGLPAPLEALVLRALAKDRAGRPGSAAAMREELVAALAGPSSADVPEKRPPPETELLAVPTVKRSRSRRNGAFAALATLALVAGAWMLLRPASGVPEARPEAAPLPFASAPKVASAPEPAAPPRPSAPLKLAPPSAPKSLPPPPAAKPRPVIRTVRGEFNSVPTPPPSTGDGVLVLQASPWAEVSVEDTMLGETPRELRIAAGTYTVRAVHPELGRREDTVTIRPGERTNWTARLGD